jgi:hypothetical protein
VRAGRGHESLSTEIRFLNPDDAARKLVGIANGVDGAGRSDLFERVTRRCRRLAVWLQLKRGDNLKSPIPSQTDLATRLGEWTCNQTVMSAKLLPEISVLTAFFWSDCRRSAPFVHAISVVNRWSRNSGF